MRRVGRLAAGLVATTSVVAGIAVALSPSRAVGVPVLPSIGLGTPLPSIGLGTLLPSIDLGTPLPSIGLGTPLPSIGLGTPLPSIGLGTPLPSIDVGTPLPSPSPGGPSPSRTSTTATGPEATPDGSAGVETAPGPGQSGAAAGGKPTVVRLPQPSPAIPDVGTWLIPAIGVAVPAVVALVFVLLQVLGGAAGVRLAHRMLQWAASFTPRWTR